MSDVHAAPLQRLEMGVEEALSEIFGSGGATTKNSLVTMSMPLLEPDIEENMGGSTPLVQSDEDESVDGEPPTEPTGGSPWLGDDRADANQLDMERLEQTMAGWPEATDSVALDSSEMVSLGDLIGTLDGPVRTAGGPAVIAQHLAPLDALAPTGATIAKPAPKVAVEGAASCGAAPPNRKEWAASEDEAIRRGVEQLGMRWRAIAAMLPGRSDDAVRNRWARLQNAGCKPISVPRVKREGVEQRQSWTRDEDAIITSSVAEFGHRWNRIAERLPKRTEHAIRNRWHRLQTAASEEAAQSQTGALGVPTIGGAPSVADSMCNIEVEAFAGFNSVVEYADV